MIKLQESTFQISTTNLSNLPPSIHFTQLMLLTSRKMELILYMICRCRGSRLDTREMGQRSRASGSTVWLVYAHVFTTISHACHIAEVTQLNHWFLKHTAPLVFTKINITKYMYEWQVRIRLHYRNKSEIKLYLQYRDESDFI